MSAPIVLLLTVSIHLPAPYGWRTGEIEMPQRYQTIEACYTDAGAEVSLSTDNRIVVAHCVRKG